MSKEFKFVGVSRHPNGEIKVRFANDAGRVRVLEKNGHTDIFFIEMEQPEHKMDCVDALLDLLDSGEHDLCEEAVAAIVDEARELGFVLEAA
jgi:hypothetical protein